MGSYVETEISRRARKLYLSQFSDKDARRTRSCVLDYDEDFRASLLNPQGKLDSHKIYRLIGECPSSRYLLRLFVFLNIDKSEINSEIYSLIKDFRLESLFTTGDRH